MVMIPTQRTNDVYPAIRAPKGGTRSKSHTDIRLNRQMIDCRVQAGQQQKNQLRPERDAIVGGQRTRPKKKTACNEHDYESRHHPR